MKTILTILAFLSLTAAAYAQRGDGSTYRCQNSKLVHVGDSAFIIKLKCGDPLHQEIINTGYGKGGQIVSEWYYPMKNG